MLRALQLLHEVRVWRCERLRGCGHREFRFGLHIFLLIHRSRHRPPFDLYERRRVRLLPRTFFAASAQTRQLTNWVMLYVQDRSEIYERRLGGFFVNEAYQRGGFPLKTLVSLMVDRTELVI